MIWFFSKKKKSFRELCPFSAFSGLMCYISTPGTSDTSFNMEILYTSPWNNKPIKILGTYSLLIEN